MAPTPTSSDNEEHPDEVDQLATGGGPQAADVVPGALDQQDPNLTNPPGGHPILNPPLLAPLLPPGIMAEKATSTIPIEKFQSGVDDFDD